MEEARVKVGPEIVAYVDDDNTKVTVEIVIPGVAQKDIDLKMLNDSFYLSALSQDLEYVAAYSFACQVEPAKAEATYNNGLLKIEVPFKNEMDNAIKIHVKTKEALTEKKQQVLSAGSAKK